MSHPARCWELPGHERCAVRAAAHLVENRAVWLRASIDNPSPEAVATALDQLGVRPPKPLRRRPGRRVLTPAQMLEARDLYGVNGGILGLVTMRQLAAYYGVSYSTIFGVIHADQAAA